MPSARPGTARSVFLRTFVIGLTAFLTLVDLFATQAILPSLTRAYGVTPAAMGFAVNASTFGMAVAGLGVAFFSAHIDRRWGILISLAVLSIPTALLASAPNLTVFTLLRVAQGLCMASAFTLTLAYLGEQCSVDDAGTAFAAYITGNVASNFVGRLISAAVADHFGLASNFYFFAALNLAGALMVYFTIARTEPMTKVAPAVLSPFRSLGGAFPQSAAARGFRHRLLHPVRVHRHVHVCELRAGARAAVARPHGAWFRLLRLPAIDRHDPDGGPRRARESARGPRSGFRWRSPAPGCRCC